MGGWNLLGGLMPPAVDTAGESERRHSRDLGAEEEFEVLNNENQDVSYAKDLSLENAILANFPDGCDRSFIVESKDEESYDIIPKNLTFAEVISILNQAVKEDNYEKLDEVIQNIEDYEGRSITLESTNLKNFCEQQLNLDLRNNQHIYSNILSQYKFNQVELKYDYLVKELVLLAIAANDKLAEKYQCILFAEGNLSLLPLLVGGQEYIKAFIEKFHSIDEVYNKIKDQTIQLVEPNKIGFFSTIALRKEQELLETVLAEPFLRDLEHVLKTSNPDPLYGVLETASLVKNEKFITLVLNAFERYINEPTKDVKDLLKGSFVTLLETVISQEHLPIIEYLCKRYINNKGSTNYDIYEQAFADDRVIKVLNQQILKNIGARDRKKIYDLVLKTVLDAGNITFIEHLCEEYAECSNDVIDYLNQKFKNNEFDNAYELALITLSNIKSKDIVIDIIAHIQIYQSISHNEQITRQVIQNILRNAVHYSTDQEDYSLVKKVCYLCTESDEIIVIFREECEIFKSSIEKRMEDLEMGNKLLQSEALHEYNYNYVLGVVNGLAQVAHVGYDIYTEDPKYNKRQKNIDLILNLMHIRNILQFSIDVQEYSCTERQDLWDQMYNTPATFMVRKKSDNIADRSTISAIESNILSENSESQSTDSKQLQSNIVDKGENIIANKKASKEAPINRRGKMPKNTKTIEKKLSDTINSIDLPSVAKLLVQPNNKVDKLILQKLLSQANDKIQSLKESKNKENQERNLRLIIKLLTERLEEIATALSVGDKADCSSTTKSPVINSTDSQQSQENVIDKGKNIINSEKASEEAIANNCEEGKMHKNIETIKEKLSNAIDSINYVNVVDLLKELEDSEYESTVQKLLSQANDKIQSLKESKNKENQERNLRLIIKLLTERLEEIATALSVGDKADCSSTTKSPVINSTDSQQSQENVIDKGKNIINSEKASEEAIANNCEEGKMHKNIETIKEKLSNAIDSINYVNVVDLLKELEDSEYESTVQKLLSQANDKIQSLKESKNKENQERNLRLIIKLLTERLEEIATALSVGDKADCSSTTKSPVINSTDSQQSQENVIDKGKNIINSEKASEEAIANNCEEGKMHKNIETIKEKLSNAIDSINYVNVVDLLKELEDSEYESTVQKLLSQANDKMTSLEEDEQKKDLTKIIALLKNDLEHTTAALPAGDNVGATASSQQIPVKEVKERESDSSSLSSEDNDFSKLEGDKSDAFAGTSSDSNSNYPFEEINEESYEIRIPIIETVEPEATASTPEMPSMATEEKPGNINDKENADQQQPADNTSVKSALSIDGDEEEQDSNQSAKCVKQTVNRDTQQETVLPVINKQSSESNQKTTTLDTKKYVVAASALAITGIALGVAVAVYLEMLAIGIAVAACCLIAATITYCYRPKSLVEDNEVKKVDDTQKSTPCCG
ncbi:hypothetical protein [Wolbachia endosymbiont of Encarsia formosa]|uniref:host RNA manipulator TomO n=1 Tax=Wolbachia endosymbiont of Encarsia formosa TaxID=77125 RepID=UPI0031BA7708